MAATDEIKGAVYALRPLRGKVENFFQFEEVREVVTSVFGNAVVGKMCFKKFAAHK